MKNTTLSALKLGAAPMVLGLALVSTSAFAQAAAEETDDNTTIVVTGSLIRNPNLAQANPVNVTTADTIELKQSNVAEEVLREVPGIVANVGSAVNNGNGGSSYVDLRGLGSNRNIVLLDGNRIVPADFQGRVDLNNIPLALINRVDSLTGAAVTTYGADAITGVVNFVTKKDFAGVDLSVGDQITEKGDGNYFRSDLTLGANFDDGRGNAVVSIGYQKSNPVYQGDRDFSTYGVDSYSGTFGGSGTSVPSRFSGTRPLTAAGVPNTDPAVANGGTRQLNAAGQAVGTYAFFNFNPYNIFQTPFKRYNIYAQANYEISDAVEVYTRGLFSKNKVSTIIAPSGSFGTPVQINLNNPFLPASLRAQFCAFDIDPRAAFYQPRFSAAECAAAALATGPSDPNYRVVGTGATAAATTLLAGGYDVNKDGVIDAKDVVTVNPGITLSRRAVESGPRISEYGSTVFDYRLGFKGGLTDTIDWDLNGSYGESEKIQTILGYTLNSRFRQALLVNGTAANPVCLDTSNGCVPANVFGQAGSISPAAASFLSQSSSSTVRTSLAQVRGVLNGDLGFTLPGASEPVGFALGSEYRRYKAKQFSDTLGKSGDLGGAGGATPDINGGYQVYEGYGEIIAPIFSMLTLEAGARYSHYKIDRGGSNNTFTYKGALTFTPTPDVKFRANYAHAVRAPNINELFSPLNTVLTNLAVDPCAGAAPTTNANLAAVCLAQGATAGQLGSITNPTAAQANITAGGNINLKPEKANTWTAGVVLQPSFLPRFSMTIDYYNIKVTDVIGAPLPGDLIGACFNNLSAASATKADCTVIRRNPLTGGLDGDPSITKGLYAPLNNLGRLATDGIDLIASYNTDLGPAKWAINFVGNYTFHSKFKATSTSVNRECTGYYSANCSFTGSLQPKFQWSLRNTFSVGKMDLSVLWRHIDKMRQEPLDVIASGPMFSGTLPIQAGAALSGKTVNFGKIPSYDIFDLTTRFNVSDNLTLTLAVQNLLNKQPPIVGSSAGSTAFDSGNTYPSSYDALGRRFAVSARVRF